MENLLRTYAEAKAMGYTNSSESWQRRRGDRRSITREYTRLRKRRNEMENLIIGGLWIAACTGDNETLENYYENGGEINRRFSKFGKSHSLIAGAYRNGNFETVELLQQYGETPLDDERDELKELYYLEVMRAAEKLVDYMRFHNKNLTKKQEKLIDELAAAMQY